MGSRLSIMTVVGALCVSTAVLAQPGPLPAADFAKQGTDLYKAGDFAGAVAPLERAVELEPNNFEYKYTLAQALRQSGQCAKALPIYRSIVDVAPDPQTQTDVKTNMALCPETSVTQTPTAPPVPPPAPTPPPEPTIVHGGVSSGNLMMVMGAGIGLGAGVAMFFAAHSDASDADEARSYADHERIKSRSDKLYIASGVSLAAGVALGVIGLYRIKVEKEHNTSVAITPRVGGGSLVLETSW